MIYTGGNSIVGAYTNGVSVKEIYANGVKVWPVTSPTPDHYITWTPSDLSTGTFTIGGSTYNFADYNGTFSFYGGTITDRAFEGAEITTIDTNAEYINHFAFKNCSSLVSANLPNVISLNDRDIFLQCYSLTYVSLPVCEYIGRGAFYSTGLTSIYGPECLSTGYGAFRYCSSLVSVSLPECTYLQSRTFADCVALEDVSLPLCETVGSIAFQSCYSLKSINLPKCNYIGEWAFERCNLSVIRLGNSSVCRLEHSSAFLGTKITSSTGSIIVPLSLLDGYRKDSVWKYFFNVIVPDYPANSYYIKWSPSVAQGSATIWYGPYGSRRQFELIFSNYRSGFLSLNNEFSLMHIGLVSTNITYFETNVLLFGLDTVSTLKSANLYECRDMYEAAFFKCNNLSFVNAPKLSYVNRAAFWSTGLQYINIESCEYVSEQAFQFCTSLKEINLPNCSKVSQQAFDSCHSLSSVSLPVCSILAFGAFAHCYALSEITLPKVSYLRDSVFYQCSNLTSLTLLSNSVVSIESYTYPFSSSPLSAGGSGKIYVPSSLVTAYKNTSMWSPYANKIYPIQ